jgi:hypothetical protein
LVKLGMTILVGLPGAAATGFCGWFLLGSADGLLGSGSGVGKLGDPPRNRPHYAKASRSGSSQEMPMIQGATA